MFRHLKNFYFLSLKFSTVYNGPQKFLDVSRISLDSSASREKVLELLLKQTNNKDWDRIMHDIQCLTRSSSFTTEIKILRCCEENQLSKQAMSFIQYLLKNNKLTEHLLTKFLDLTRKDPKNYEPSHRLIYMLFTKYLHHSPTIAQNCALTLFQYPVLFDNAFKIYMENLHGFTEHEKAMQCLISCNRVEEAFELYLRTFSSMNFQVFLLQILENELKNKRMPYKISEVVQHLIEHLDYFKKFLQYSSEFSSVLSLINKIDKNYEWKMNSAPSRNTKCDSCGEYLEQSVITRKEIKFLLHEFEKEIVSRNVFILSFKEKWNTFLQFLDKVDYNVVIDGLNVFYTLKGNMKKVTTAIDFIAAKRNKLLIITKKHNKKAILSSGLYSISSVFYTDDDQQDDVYILYAALRQGLGCLLFTHDKYGFYKSRISPQFREIYRRWEECHIGTVLKNNFIVWPVGLKSGIKKKNYDDPSEFKYHIVTNTIENYPIVSCIWRRKIEK